MNAASVVSIVVADDHTLFRQGLYQLIGTDPGLSVVAMGTNGPEAVALVSQHRPHVAIIDVEMPGDGAERTVDALRRAAPETKIVVLTMHDDAGLVRRLLDRGASAYLVKSISRDQLVATLWTLARGADDRDVLLSVSRATITRLDDRRERMLTAREAEVLRLCADAKSNAEIGRLLQITEGTVKRHLTNIFAKLGAVSRLDAVRKGIERDEISLD